MLLNYIKRLIFLRNHKSLFLNMPNNDTINNDTINNNTINNDTINSNTINNDTINNLEILNKSSINNYYTFLKKKKLQKELKKYEGTNDYITLGVDEVARGCLVGPVVSACVIIDDEKLLSLTMT